ncbi:AmmeMemoRadiSam system protein B, partial [Candidatus Woesearchaeota archaeon]|nr:AmmeMemoRadiSam system protein B [Candidatus Woesearchaeota archaeon]
KLSGDLKSLIVPHAGYIYSGKIAAYAYSLLRRYKNKKLKIILLGPSHFVYFNNVATDVNDYWETPLGKVKIANNDFLKLENAHVQEHCLEVQLPFLQETVQNFEILPLVTGDISPKIISKRIQALLDENSILVISSDLSHYNDYKTAVKIDRNSISAIQKLNYDKFLLEGDACGKIPILSVVDIAKNLNWKCKLLEYKNSGDTAGNKDSVVGYASFVYY